MVGIRIDFFWAVMFNKSTYKLSLYVLFLSMFVQCINNMCICGCVYVQAILLLFFICDTFLFVQF